MVEGEGREMGLGWGLGSEQGFSASRVEKGRESLYELEAGHFPPAPTPFSILRVAPSGGLVLVFYTWAWHWCCPHPSSYRCREIFSTVIE